jgi:hypothetical protein
MRSDFRRSLALLGTSFIADLSCRQKKDNPRLPSLSSSQQELRSILNEHGVILALPADAAPVKKRRAWE